MDYAQHWSTVMNTYGRQAEILGSVTEETLNNFLKKHFKKDKERYAFSKEFTFNDGQKDRTFKLAVKAQTPIRLDLVPFNQALDPSGWNDVPMALDTDGAQLGSSSNLRVSMDRLTISLSWDDGANALPDLKLSLEGLVRLFLDKNMDGKHALFTELNKVRFSQVAMAEATLLLNEQAKGAQSMLADDKCQELIIIVLNIIANNYAPRTIEALELPAPDIGDLPSVPAFFDISNNILTVGYDTDRAARKAVFDNQVEEAFVRYEAALLRDIENAGSLEALFLPDGAQSARSLEEVTPLTEQEIEVRMPETTALLKEMDAMGRAMTVLPSKSATTAAEVDAVRGFAIGINEYALDAMAEASLDQRRRSDCTKWIKVVVVKGRACYWAQLKNPDVTLSGNATDARLGGSIFVDVGAYIEACVRRVWRCSTKWSCSRAGLSLVGPGKVALNLKTNGSKGVVIGGKIETLPKFHADLPFPFNKVVEILLNLILKAVKVIVNSILAFLKVRVVSKEISLPTQKTKLNLDKFATGYVAIDVSAGGTASQTRYLTVGAEATAG